MGVVISKNPFSVISLPQLGHHLTAQDDVGLHGGVAQVEEAVFQAGVLVGVLALVDLEGQLVVNGSLPSTSIFSGHDLDLAGGQLGVLALPLPDDAGDLRWWTPCSWALMGFIISSVLNDHLGGAVEVPQDAEARSSRQPPGQFSSQPTMVTDLPASERRSSPQLWVLDCIMDENLSYIWCFLI